MDPADVVLRFLESVGRRDEAEFYLALFRSEAKERFACIAVDASVARHALDAVVMDLRFLAALGLTPIVNLGLFHPGEAMEHASRLRRRLLVGGVVAAMMPSDAGEGGVRDAFRAGALPIVGYRNEGSTDEQRFAQIETLLRGLGTRKLIFLHKRGGLAVGGARVPVVNLTTDFATLRGSKDLSGKQRAMLSWANHLVHGLADQRLVASITSPIDLLRELFTVRGAGTLLRRGAVIDRKAGWAEIDRARFAALVEASFGRAPVPELFDREVSRIFLEEAYRGAAVVIDTPLGAYLSKFVVERAAQGEGIGRDLWAAMLNEHPTLFWRARADNPINDWYGRQADGLARLGRWTVFWKGLAYERLPEAITFALARPLDLVEQASA